MQCCYLFVLRVKCKMLIFLNEVRYVCLFRGEDSPDKSRARSKHFKKEIEASDSDSDQRSRSKVRKEKIRSIVSKKAAAPDSDSDSSGDSWEQERPPSDRPGIVCLKKKKGRPGGGGLFSRASFIRVEETIYERRMFNGFILYAHNYQLNIFFYISFNLLNFAICFD